MLTCSRANVSCMLKCSRANVPCMFKCSRANVPRVLTCSRTNVSCVLTCLWSNVSCVIRAHVPTYLTPLCADVPTCLECLRVSHVNMTCVLTRVKVACELICSHTNMPWVSCLTLLAWPRDHRLACLACLVSSFDAAFFQFNCHYCWSCSYCWWGSTISLMLFLSNVNSYIIKVY